MSPREVFRFAVLGLLANKIRSLLTMLGILIGVAAVIVLVAVGQGSSDAVASSIESLGSNTITVSGSSGGAGGLGGLPGGPGGVGASTASTDTGTDITDLNLTLEDARALNDPSVAPHVESASPVTTAQVDCTVGASSHSVTITGTWPTYFEASNSPVASGGYFEVDAVDGDRRSP